MSNSTRSIPRWKITAWAVAGTVAAAAIVGAFAYSVQTNDMAQAALPRSEAITMDMVTNAIQAHELATQSHYATKAEVQAMDNRNMEAIRRIEGKIDQVLQHLLSL